MKTTILLAGAAAMLMSVPAFAQISTGGSAGTLAGPQLGATPPGSPPQVEQPPSPMGSGASASGGVNTQAQVPVTPQAGVTDQSGYSARTSKDRKARPSSGSSTAPGATVGTSVNGDVSPPPRL